MKKLHLGLVLLQATKASLDVCFFIPRPNASRTKFMGCLNRLMFSTRGVQQNDEFGFTFFARYVKISFD